MSLVLSLAGAWFAFLIALAADVVRWWPCAVCGRRVDAPMHFACDGRWCPDRRAHHHYARPVWPFVVLGAPLMLVVVVALGLVR